MWDMRTVANKMFAQWWGDVLVESVIFVQRFVSGTGRGFESPPLRKHKRYAQCRGTDSVLRTLALLLAANSRATPKQVKEPIKTGNERRIGLQF